jgi:hypothetical protein
MSRVALGILLLVIPWIYFGWRMHRKGQLKPLLQGMAMGAGFCLWIFTCMWLILPASRG